MYIKDVCRECKLTKKAIEYYEQQGLISPKREDNGYRNYSDEDISVLKEIGVLRKLGISIDDIKNILTSSNKAPALEKIKYKMDLEIEKSMAKKKCLEQLMQDYDIEYAIKYIEENIERNFTIKEKLLQGFPGSYGMFCGYSDVFIENLKILSDSYKEYFKKLQAANKVFIEKYPEVNNIYEL